MLAKRYAALADIFIMDAFATATRKPQPAVWQPISRKRYGIINGGGIKASSAINA